ncbi:HIT family protein [Buchananella hordeovulneris]|uniref:Diadenosine tetraphosphate hydrolase n=1 Tax=Buchananella hordeovulneris TaxID=52770 RepID=A0A1Q5PWM6_9ACTO|nr:HIT family protein [Buchananella hordeovulneris]OKL52001.1 diadenosine tetraphosphate hydrolase [Buchananella hordeovulneris]
MSTVFSQIIAGNIPGYFAWADETCVAFATIAPVTDGHLLVVPRAEVERYTAADDATLAHLAVVAGRIGRAQEEALGCLRAGIVVAGFEVPHLHVHVVPLWEEGQLTLARARTDVPPAQIQAAVDKVRSALQAAGWGEFVPADATRVAG